MKLLLQEIRPAIIATFVLAGITCGLYPLLVTTVAQAAFKDQAQGSLIIGPGGKVRGSSVLGQNFTSERYFHTRPSAAGSGYDGASSSGSNLGPTSQKLRDQIQERLVAYRTLNGLAADAEVPADAVTASGSGLDPHISVKNATIQAPRVAKARNLPLPQVERLIAAHTSTPTFGLLGEARVNVVSLNLALDAVK